MIICAFITRAHSDTVIYFVDRSVSFNIQRVLRALKIIIKRNTKICFRYFSLPLQSIHDCVLPPCYSKCNIMIRKCDWRSVRQTSDHTFHTMLRVHIPRFVCDSWNRYYCEIHLNILYRILCMLACTCKPLPYTCYNDF